MSLNGALSSNWNVNVGYTYAKNENATGADKGEPLDPRIPKQIFRVASTYKIPGSDWTVGGNLRAQSRTWGAGANKGIKQGGFALFGLMAKYRINDQAEVSITANNVFDREYRYPNTLRGTHYGEPRRLALTAKYFF